MTDEEFKRPFAGRQDDGSYLLDVRIRVKKGEPITYRTLNTHYYHGQEPCDYRDFSDMQAFSVEIPRGSDSDGASVPHRLLWAALTAVGFGKVRALPAALLHDHIYRRLDEKVFSRRDADAVWRQIGRDCGLGLWGSWIAWTLVRLCGRWSWCKIKQTNQ